MNEPKDQKKNAQNNLTNCCATMKNVIVIHRELSTNKRQR